MKKNLLALILSLFSLVTISQEKILEDNVYIYIKNQHFIGDVLGYKGIFYMASADKRFQSDNYYFKIDFGGLDYRSLYSLGTPVNIDSINIVNPQEYFKNKSNCEVHTELSLFKRIYIVTDIPQSKMNLEDNKSKKHIMFFTSYAGTLKNWIYTNPMGKNLIDD